MHSLFGRLDDAAGGLIDRLGRSLPLAILLIAAVAAVLLVPGQSELPLTDRDEARYVLASKQMMESGDFIEPRNLDQPRWKKPAGIYWLQSAAALASGDGAAAPLWVYRLPSSLGIVAAALLTLWAFRPMIGQGAAAVAGLVVAACVVTAFEGHIAKTDAALLALIVLAQGGLIRALDRPPEFGFGWPHALFWSALAAGFLVKGPVILIVVAGTLLWLTVAELSVDAVRRTKPWPGVVLFAALTLPWYLAIGVRTDWGFYAEALGRDLLGKVGGAAEGHVGPPGYYLMTVWVTFWPWTPLALLSLPLAWRLRRREEMRLIAGWIVPTWAVFAFATTKLPHYVMPALPAVGALAGMWLVSTREPWRPVLGWIAAVLFLLGGAIVAGLTVAAPLWFEGDLMLRPLVLGLAGLVPVLLGALALGLGYPRATACLGVAAAAILLPALIRDTLPRLDSLFLSERMAALDARFDACAPRPVVSTGYEELSLAFLAGTDTVFGNPGRVAIILGGAEDGWRIFAPLSEAGTLAGKSGVEIERIATLSGINYNAGPEVVEYGLYARAGDPLLAPCLTP